MRNYYNHDNACEKAEKLQALLYLIYERGCEGVEDDNPIIANALNLSAYINSYFASVQKEITRQELGELLDKRMRDK